MTTPGPDALPSPAPRWVGLGRRTPFAAAAAVAVATVALLVSAPVMVGTAPAFLPAFLTLVLASDLLTCVLLVVRYLNVGGPRVLALSWAYTWSAVTIVPYALVFPGLAAPQGLFGASPSTSAWLWASWHTGFPLLLAMALAPWSEKFLRRLDIREHRLRRILLSHGVVAALAGLVAVLVVVDPGGMEPLVLADGDYSAFTRLAGPWIGLVGVVALVVALRGLQTRQARGVETWAVVALTASGGDTTLSLLAEGRFTVGWYGARALTTIASVVVLLSIFRGFTLLHRRVRDTADQLAAQNAALLEAQELRDHVTAVVSHDLRSPIAGLTGYLELLGEGDLPPATVDRMIARSQRLTRRLTLLTEDLLAVSTVGHSTLEVVARNLDVAEQLEEVAEEYPERDVRVACEPGLRVAADPLRLQQILDNLLTNAFKYGAEPVTLRACRERTASGAPGDVRIEVTDAGAGVPAEFVERLFERYTRAEGHPVTGSGLGLSVVADLVAAHGGRVAYEAERNAFVITLDHVPEIVTVASPPRSRTG